MPVHLCNKCCQPCPPPPPPPCPPPPCVASGCVVRDSSSNSRVIAQFNINGQTNIFTCNLSNSVQFFSCTHATLTYRSGDDLTGTRIFQGSVGTNEVTLTLGNGVVIHGVLDNSIGMNASENGSGVWEQT
ncbi:hypothetical protein OBBRIDRAFT_420038 [Obba rivulosa]|uniref:Uncharacterized protein n=1 Tax=Obba rivulosa TaxID=1052685 RepID=A0A8E2AL80_9APHY|nr:hypothetical protein OBBRIDRAFT_420038 [Obba rivulosa]